MNNNNNMQNENNENLVQENPQLNVEEMNTRKLQAYAIIIVAVVVLIFGLFSFLKKDKKEEVVTKQEIGTSIKNTNLSFKEDNNEEKKSFKDLILETPAPVEENTKFEPIPKETTTLIKLRVLKGSGSLIVNSQSSSSNNAKQAPIDITDSDAYTFDDDGNIIPTKTKKENNSNIQLDTDRSFVGETFTPTAARVADFDPNLLLPKGTYIGCSLDTRLVSSIKGGISCTVSDNVYSSNGSTLLIEKGSKITGFFNSGQMNDGLDRIFVVWQEIRTPNNINIPVFSGASDELGGSGVVGWVDNHWLKRFGSAILLSVIDDAFNVIANGTRRGNSNVDLTENTRESTKNMADTALQKFINIQPTLYKNQGDLVGVYVNRDIDFSKVYKLKLKKRLHK